MIMDNSMFDFNLLLSGKMTIFAMVIFMLVQNKDNQKG